MAILQRRRRSILIVLLVLFGAIAAPRIPTVAAAGSLYVTPSTVTPQAVGTTFSVLVKVAGFDQFNGWEIQIVSDPTVINATSISTAGNIFVANTTGGQPFELRNCVNGGGQGCCLTSSCSPLDGPGIADSAVGSTRLVSGSGLLFNVTFQVVSTKPYSPIIIKNDALSNTAGSFVDHTTTIGSYGTAHDFTLTPSPSLLDLPVNSSGTSAITLTSRDHFSGVVNLTLTLSGKGVTATLSPNQTTLSDGGSAVSNLVVHALANASATSYTITLFAVSSSLPADSFPHTSQLTVSVHDPDFTAYATPSLLLTHQASSNSTTITVTSEYKFTGTVNLTVLGPTQARLDNSSLKIPIGGSATTTLTVSTQSSAFAFEDDFDVNATGVGINGLLVHRVTVIAEPPPGDFSISANPGTVSVQAGTTEVVSIGVASQDYFAGTVYILGASKSGLGLSFDPGSIFINISQTEFFKLKITTDTSTALGNHTIDLTVYGQLIGKAGAGIPPRQHTTTFTLIVTGIQQAATPTFLGLQEPVFYGMIGGLALVLALLGFFEARGTRRLKSRLIPEG